MQDIFKKLKRGEIKIRKSLNTHMQGGRRSLFKGAGLEFDDVRPYQYGDDVRSIHWSVSSKGHGLYVKTFKEEREQTIFFLVDVSASQKIGLEERQKMDLTREVCGTLLLSAADDANQVGLLLFTARTEYLLKPKKGATHAYRLLHTLYNHQLRATRTDIASALRKSLHLIKKTSIFVLISDFIDQGYTELLKSVARRHDLILLHVQSPEERHFPALGILPFYEPELGKLRWVNTQSPYFKAQWQSQLQARMDELKELSLRHHADYVSLRTGEDYLPQLIHLFRNRNRKRGAR